MNKYSEIINELQVVSNLIDKLKIKNKQLQESRDWYKLRCELLQKHQISFRDPERQIVCNILANGMAARMVKGNSAYCEHSMQDHYFDSFGVYRCEKCEETIVRYGTGYEIKSRDDV